MELRMRVDAPESTGSCARNRNPLAGVQRLGAGAEAGAHQLRRTGWVRG